MHSTRLTLFLLALVAVVTGGVISAGVPAAAAPARPARDRAAITGRVTDTDGHPLANVRVFAEFEYGLTRTRTGPDGRFRVSVAGDAGPAYVGIDGAVARGGLSDQTGYSGAERVVFHVVPGAVRRLGVLRLHAAGALRGRVTDEAGHPLAGVVAYLQPVLPYVPIENVGILYSFSGVDRFRTNAQGRFVIKGASPGAERVCFDADHASVVAGGDGRLGYRSTCLADSEALASGVTRALPVTALAAQPGAVVTGSVRAMGRAVPHQLIDIVGMHTFSVLSARSDSNGRYRVSGLPADRYRICAWPGGSRALFPFGLLSKCAGVRVAAPGGVVRAPTLRLPVGGAASGRLVAVNGSPVVGARIWLEGVNNIGDGSAQTGPSGRYRAIALRPGRYRACPDTTNAAAAGMRWGVRHGRCTAPFRVRARAVTTVTEPRLPAGAAVVGQITDKDGQPVADAAVTTENFSVEADRHGRYQLTGLVPGTVRVCATRLDNPFSPIQRCRRGVQVSAGRATTVNLSVPDLGSVHVQVHDEAGHPITGANAALLAPCRPTVCSRYSAFGGPAAVRDSQTTGPRGGATIVGVRPGRYAVCIHGYFATTTTGAPQRGYADQCTGTTFTVVVRRGQTTPVTLTLHEGAVVTGRVTDTTGQPLGNVLVHVARSAADDYGTDTTDGGLETGAAGLDGNDPASYSRTDADGYYRIRSVVPSRQRICFDASNAVGGSSTQGYHSQCVGGLPGTLDSGTRVDVTDTTNVDIQLTAGHDTTTTPLATTRHPRRCVDEQVAKVTGGPIVFASSTCTARATFGAPSPGNRLRPNSYDRLILNGPPAALK